jgi:hypothetical protein
MAAVTIVALDWMPRQVAFGMTLGLAAWCVAEIWRGGHR